jgi:multimeric flavodoxin WrbA
MTKKILILNGSPRRRGNSAVLADQLAEGARSRGAEVESVYLHGLDIRACDGCDACHELEEGCIIRDDMQPLYPKLREADVIVIATPVYWFSVSAQTKLCIDRWYALETSKGSALKGKQFALLLVYGDSDLHTSGGINAVGTFESLARYLKAEIVGIVHGSVSAVGDAEKQPILMQSAYELGTKIG